MKRWPWVLSLACFALVAAILVATSADQPRLSGKQLPASTVSAPTEQAPTPPSDLMGRIAADWR